MPLDVTKTVIRSLGRAASQERSKGNHSSANGIALIALGIFLLPLPFVGVPMIITGISKLCS